MSKSRIVISGMGPGGLAAAWEAAKRGYHVTIITDRSDKFVRVQRVFLDDKSVNYLRGMQSAEAKELERLDKKLFDDVPYVAIKDVERYIQRRLAEFPPNQITYHLQSQLSDIDMGQGQCTIQTLSTLVEKEGSSVVEFDFIIGADGGKHHAANLVGCEYEPVQSPAYVYHGSFYLTIEKEDGTEFGLPKDNPGYISFIKKKDDETKEEDWPLCAVLVIDLRSYDKYKYKKTKANLVSEMPKEIFERIKLNPSSEKTRDVMHDYIQHCATECLGKIGKENNFKIQIVAPSKKYGVQKDKLKAQVFEVDLMKAKKAAMAKGAKSFILLGDAYQQANYQVMHGMNDSLLHAEWIGQLISNKMTIEDYNEKCQTQSRRVILGAAGTKKMHSILKSLSYCELYSSDVVEWISNNLPLEELIRASGHNALQVVHAFSKLCQENILTGSM